MLKTATRNYEQEITQFNAAAPIGSEVRLGRHRRTWFTSGPAKMGDNGRPVVPIAGVGPVWLEIVHPLCLEQFVSSATDED